MNKLIDEYAKKQIRGRSRTRKYPIFPADIPAKLPKLPNTRTVLWDIYGTLLGHPMGDMADNSLMEKSTRQAFRQTAREFGLDKFLSSDPVVSLREIYEREIKKTHRRKESRGVFSPEVRIEQIWLRILRQLEKEGYRPKSGRIDLSLALKVAYFFDDTQQFKLLYPGARRTLETIKQKGLMQGIISNAQFYTPITLNLLLRNSSSGKPMKELFNRRLVFFSYQLGVGKPNPLGFEQARERLMRMGIGPSFVIFVGNDMLFDMVLAHKSGFKTILFAGDRRSITLRKNNPEVAGFEPDGIIKSLPQLLEIIN
jgi:putative hydrolase of the HAD superfamily